jgi:hypothetical protein
MYNLNALVYDKLKFTDNNVIFENKIDTENNLNFENMPIFNNIKIMVGKKYYIFRMNLK